MDRRDQNIILRLDINVCTFSTSVYAVPSRPRSTSNSRERAVLMTAQSRVVFDIVNSKYRVSTKLQLLIFSRSV